MERVLASYPGRATLFFRSFYDSCHKAGKHLDAHARRAKPQGENAYELSKMLIEHGSEGHRRRGN